VSAGETVKWSSGDGDADNDSMGLIVSVMMVDGRCQSERGGKTFYQEQVKATLSSRTGTGRSWLREEGVSQRGKDTCALG
jgi:hypothetical protein